MGPRSWWGALGGGALTAAYFLVQKARGTLGDYSVISRFYWSVDALRMMLHRPIFGFGGRGWEAAYHACQSHGYWSTEVHNHFAQVAVETGAVGLLAFLAMWALLGREAYLLKDLPPAPRVWGRGAHGLGYALRVDVRNRPLRRQLHPGQRRLGVGQTER